MSKDLEALVKRVGPQAVLEALSGVASDERADRIDEVLNQRLGSIVLCMEELYDPHNGAAVLRTADAMGIQNIHFVSGAKGSFSAEKTVTIGAHKWLSVEHSDSLMGTLSSLKNAGYISCATSPRGTVDLGEIDVSRPMALWFGNERDGISNILEEHVDVCAKIPMFGFSESFNLSVSAALCLQELCKRRRQFLNQPGDLSEFVKTSLRALWLAKGVRGAEKIIERYVSKHPPQSGEFDSFSVS